MILSLQMCIQIMEVTGVSRTKLIRHALEKAKVDLLKKDEDLSTIFLVSRLSNLCLT
jgi:hypothetical protein